MTGTKTALRKELLDRRNRMTKPERTEKSRRILAALLEHTLVSEAEQILCYVNTGNEVETIRFLEACLKRGKAVYCPLVSQGDMDFYRIVTTRQLQPGFHGILEPPGEPSSLFSPGKTACGEPAPLMVLPGVVFDRQHHRIGYGGGYYDRYLERVPGLTTLALAFSFQVREAIPYEPYDICPQILLTENGEV